MARRAGSGAEDLDLSRRRRSKRQVAYGQDFRAIARCNCAVDDDFGINRTSTAKGAIDRYRLAIYQVSIDRQASPCIDIEIVAIQIKICLLYTSPSPRDRG